MTCAEFQAVLAYIIDNGGNAEQQEHLRECAVCSDLVADLKYIAEQAKLLVPMMDPSRRVWEGIKSSLEREGLVKDSARGSLLGSTPLARWGPANWLFPVAAVLLVAIGLLYYQNRTASPTSATLQNPADDAEVAVAPEAPLQFASMDNSQDQQILSEIAAHVPALSESYRQDLQRVNTYITDARSLVTSNPNDEESRQALMEAYQQKAMLYKMAMRHSLP